MWGGARMSCDLMGSKQRAWLCAGNGSIFDPVARKPSLLCAIGERPILVIPDTYGPAEIELAFGWAMADLREQSQGWLGLLRGLLRLLQETDMAA